MRAEERKSVSKKIADLQKQVSSLRKSIAKHKHVLPDEAFEVLEIHVAGTLFSVDVHSVLRVTDSTWCTPLADAQRGVLGQILYRDNSLPILDLSCILDAQSATPILERKFVLLRSDQNQFGLIADDVSSSYIVHPEQFQSIDTDLSYSDCIVTCFRNQDDDVVQHLAIDALIDEFECLSNPK